MLIKAVIERYMYNQRYDTNDGCCRQQLSLKITAKKPLQKAT